jgi:hypothetical protein
MMCDFGSKWRYGMYAGPRQGAQEEGQIEAELMVSLDPSMANQGAPQFAG